MIVNNRAEWRKLKFPDPDLPVRMEQPRRAVALANDAVAGNPLAVVGAVRGPFSGAWMAAGMVNMSNWIYKDPELLNDVLREMARWNTQVGLNLIAAGVDAIMIHDDWGMNMGLMIKPDHWRRYVLPHIAEEVSALAATGTPVIMHSDGNLNAIMDDIAQLEIAALNPLQRNAGMNLAQLKRRYGDRLCLIGNISATVTLPHRGVTEVALEALECIRDAAPGGGYIMAPDHSYHGAVPSENVRAVFETCQEYGAYPLDLPAIEARIAELALLAAPRAVEVARTQPAPVKRGRRGRRGKI
jgi:uroporphyrinogen decarboxylase